MPGAPPRIFAWRAQAGVGDRGTGSCRDVWERVEPLLPPAKPRRRRHPVGGHRSASRGAAGPLLPAQTRCRPGRHGHRPADDTARSAPDALEPGEERVHRAAAQAGPPARRSRCRRARGSGVEQRLEHPLRRDGDARLGDHARTLPRTRCRANPRRLLLSALTEGRPSSTLPTWRRGTLPEEHPLRPNGGGSEGRSSGSCSSCSRSSD